MIILENVSKSFQHGINPPSLVLSNINLEVHEGQFVCVLGPSGCGKTTLLNLIAGFIYPSKGRVLFEGKEVVFPGPDRGVVFQDPTLFPWLTVKENVEFGLKLRGMKGRLLDETSFRYLESMGLAAHAEKYPHSLSGGMRQRVAISRVLALEPKVLLMDEPFSALDANTRERLQEELLRVWMNHRRTVIYVTHSVEEAVFLADCIILLGDPSSGVYADMPVLQERPRNRSTPEFFSMIEKLRVFLSAQPCCIQPLP
jgi:NitT/TauT family transport system ATP-binding protein